MNPTRGMAWRIPAALLCWIASGWCVVWGQDEAAPPKPVPARPAPAASDKPVLRGLLLTRYRGRESHEAADQDVLQTLSLDIGHPDDDMTLHLYGRAAGDVDGHHAERGFYEFSDIGDSYRRDVTAQLIYAHADLRRTGPMDLLRAGRQIDVETPLPLSFDGVRFDPAVWSHSEVGEIHTGVYGGVPVHPYESSPRGDHIAGGFIRADLIEGTKVRADVVDIRDALLLGVERDTLYATEVRQAVGERSEVMARETWHDAEPRDISFAGIWDREDWGFRGQASLYRLVETQRDLPTDFDAFTRFVREYRPYDQARAMAAKEFGGMWRLEGGADVRMLRNDLDEGEFNREFRRLYVTGAAARWPCEEMDVSLTMESWDVLHTEDGDIRTAGGDMTYRFSKEVRALLSSNYALYKFDDLLDFERERVRTHALKLAYDARDDLRLDLRLEAEDGDSSDVRTIALTAKYSF